MCTTWNGKAWDRPATPDDLEFLKRLYPDLGGTILDNIFEAITDACRPKAAVLVALSELASRHRRGDWSHGMRGVTLMPFSAMDFQSFERLQAGAMDTFHDALLAFTLGMRNVNLLRATLKKHGMTFITYCDCGCGVVDYPDTEFVNSQFYCDLNEFRSWGESAGCHVGRSSFGAIAGRNTDMCAEEILSYQRMEEALSALPELARPRPHEIEAVADRLERTLLSASVNFDRLAQAAA